MTRDEADQLAGLIVKTWRAGPSLEIWADELGTMRHNQAEATYRKLRREAEHAPTIATFWAVYRNLAGDNRPTHECDTCGGSGWTSKPETHNGHDYSVACACHCPNAQGIDKQRQAIVATNDRNNGRTPR